MLNLAGIAHDSIVDGPGLRTTIFVQGCPHHCPGCHNPETWEFGTGTDVSVEEIFAEIRTNVLCHAVTFSGGEPFSQASELASLARILKDNGYEVASYSGYTFEELMDGTSDQKELLELIDVLIDGPFILEEKSLELNFRGSRNQRILNIPESLKEGKSVPETSSRWMGIY